MYVIYLQKNYIYRLLLNNAIENTYGEMQSTIFDDFKTVL